MKVGRIQNYNNWSPEMVPDPETTCLGLEYFCFEGDGLWTCRMQRLMELGKAEWRSSVWSAGNGHGRHRGSRAEGLSRIRRHLPGGACA